MFLDISLNLCRPPWTNTGFSFQQRKSLHINNDSPPFNLSVDLHIKKKFFLCSLKCISFNFFRFFGKNHETLFFSLCYQPWSFILSFIHSFIHSYIHSPSPRRFHWGIIYENRSHFASTSQAKPDPQTGASLAYIHMYVHPYPHPPLFTKNIFMHPTILKHFIYQLCSLPSVIMMHFHTWTALLRILLLLLASRYFYCCSLTWNEASV